MSQRIQDTHTGEVATAHEEMDYIVDDPYLVFTLGETNVRVHPDDMVRGQVLIANVRGQGTLEFSVL